MDIDFDQNSPICLQTKTTGTIDGTGVGYGYYAYVSGGTVGRFRARTSKLLVGAELTITLKNPGTVENVVSVQGPNVVVLLKHNGAIITGTMAEVALALDAFRGPAGQLSPIVAGVTTDGVMTALARTSLAGGLDYTIVRGLIQANLGSANGGLIYFNSKSPIAVVQIEVDYPGTPKLELVSVDSGLIVTNPINMTAQLTSGVFIGGAYREIIVGTTQALKFSGGSAGASLIRIWTRKTSVML
jgi:hypothetical protein